MWAGFLRPLVSTPWDYNRAFCTPGVGQIEKGGKRSWGWGVVNCINQLGDEAELERGKDSFEGSVGPGDRLGSIIKTLTDLRHALLAKTVGLIEYILKFKTPVGATTSQEGGGGKKA